MARMLRAGAAAALAAALLSCGGGGGGGISTGVGTSPAAANVADVVVDSGPSNSSVNTLFTTVTVCVPGSTTNCQTIDHIQVDTASFGLRILASVLTLTLPVQKATDGNSLVECTVFADGYSWGPVELTDMQIAGEAAASLPIQVIGDPRFTSVPSDCSDAGPTEEDTVATFGANGILGIGVFMQDCGQACVNSANPQYYYSCTASACQATTVPLAGQVANPESFFAVDNNGAIIDLPSVAAQGATSITGSLIFGIDTQSNNASGNGTVLTVDPNYGYLTALFNGQTLSQSFIDTGSNGNYFDDSNIPLCSESDLSTFYCPVNSQSLTATLQGANGMTAAVNFITGNAQTMLADSTTFAVFPELAGTNPVSGSFDFGLPFYYGRRVATALELQTTSAGTGPYIAF